MRSALLIFFFLPIGFCALYGQCPISVDAGEDVWLCQMPGSAQLNGSIAGNYLNFSWTPTAGMQGANTLTPTVTVNGPATFVMTGRAVDMGNNLIVNGDFEGGNYGFTSDYTYSPTNLVPEGTYAVLPNPQAAHAGFAPCSDHTSGGGNMMAVNGAGVPNQNVWCQTVAVQPNTQYVFSAWVTSLHPSSPARLQFSINGNTIGPIFVAPNQTCVWLNFYTTWNSGSNTSATICIVNQNTVLGGNDFALDDIVFSPVCSVSDTVQVHIVQLQAVAAPAFSVIPCEGSRLTLSGVGSSSGQNISYRWETTNGNIVSGENTLHPVVDAAGSYMLVVTFNNGAVECTKTATANVIPTSNPLSAWISPPLPIGCGGTAVALRGFTNQPAFAQYQWTSGPGGHFTSKPDSATVWVDRPGTYTLVVTNTATGCTAQATVTVLSATERPNAVANADISVFYCTSDTFRLSGNGSSVGPEYTYLWSAMQGGRVVEGTDSLNARANAPGMYVLRVTNTSNGCVSYDTVVVEDLRRLPVFRIDSPSTFTCLTDTIWLRAHVDSEAVRVLWRQVEGAPLSGDSAGLWVGVLGPGIYSLQVTDTVTLCSAADTVVVPADTLAPVASILPPDTLTCQRSQIVLSGEGSSEGPTFRYRWTAANGGVIEGADSLRTAVARAPGSYFLQVTNVQNGCTAVASQTVVADAEVLIAVANAPELLTCARTEVRLNANGSTQQAGLTYMWSTADGSILADAQTPTPLVGALGTYVLQISHPSNGCTASATVVVAQDTQAPPIGIAPAGPITCLTPRLTLIGQHFGAKAAQFEWTTLDGHIADGAQTLTPVIASGGTYLLTAYYPHNGCAATASAEVGTDTVSPHVYVAPALPISCAEPIRVLDASASAGGALFSYTWQTDGEGHFASDTQTLHPAVDAPGTYTLTVYNLQNGCSQTATAKVDIDTISPLALAGPDRQLTCYAPTAMLSAEMVQTGVHYQWHTNDGAFGGPADTPQVEAIQAGTYVLQATRPQNGCTAADTVRITSNQSAPEIALLAPQTTLTCEHLTVILGLAAVQPHWKVRWTTSGGAPLGDTTHIAVSLPGIYSAAVLDVENGCTSDTSVQVHIDTLPPQVFVLPPDTLTCTRTETMLRGGLHDPDTAVIFSWSVLAGPALINAADLEPIAIGPGQYRLTAVLLRNGCSSFADVDVFENREKPDVLLTGDTLINCYRPTATLKGHTSVVNALISWSVLDGGNIAAGAETLSPIVDAPGTYVLAVARLDNGCSDSRGITVFADLEPLQVSILPPDTLTCERNRVVLQGSAHPMGNASAQWSAADGGLILSGAHTFSPEVGAPGRYTLTVIRTENGCSAVAEVVVQQDTAAPLVTSIDAARITCSTPVVTAAVLPDTAAYAYQWQTTDGHLIGGQNSARALANQPGHYFLTVTDPRTGCLSRHLVAIAADTTAPQVSIIPPEVLTCATSEVALRAVVALVSPETADFYWTTLGGNITAGEKDTLVIASAPGSYTLTVQNTANGCTASSSTFVAQDTAAPHLRIAPVLPITCVRTQSLLDASASTGKGALIFAWSGPSATGNQNAPQLTAHRPGAYALTLTDMSNGCSASAAVEVPADTTPPIPLLAPLLPLTCERESIRIDASASMGKPPLQAFWSTAQGHFLSDTNSLSPLVDAPGVYVLLLTDGGNGCTATATALVKEDRVPPKVDAGPDQQLYCSHPEALLQGKSSAPGPLSFQWQTVSGGPLWGDTLSEQVLAKQPGVYRLTAKQLSNGCTAFDEVEVVEIEPPAFEVILQQPDCHVANGSVRFVAAPGGLPPFQYSIDGGRRFYSSSEYSALSPGTYQLVVRDALGCTSSQEVTVVAPHFPQVHFSKITSIELGDSVQLEPLLNIPYTQVVDWHWTPSDGLSCDDCPLPWARPKQTTRYRLRTYDLNGCTAEAQVLVPVSRRRLLYAPNIFSPDGDGYNDRFTLYGNRGVEAIRSLEVFDRWGNLVFSGRDLVPNVETQGWDGTFRGQAVMPGVYVWKAVVAFWDGLEEVFAGDVTVYR